jgi:glutathione S-transferase
MENIFVFVCIGFFYTFTGPAASLAINLFRVSAIGRIVHTIAYAIIPMQPARAIAWFACYGSTIYMAIQVVFFFM